MTSTTRCAACKYLRRRCSSDCIFSPYFPSHNPQRFASVHKQLPVNLRAEAADSLYYEAQCRIQDPVYGCVGIISILQQQVNHVQNEIAKAQAEILVLNANTTTAQGQPHSDEYHQLASS
ncbi:hypothetical protein RHGRI_009278 [Rhododendron griersonianum]|uniref:LOB domain-containing protein n=1 Tax=Rhododendron griersonianum TaxID=479676 RepID=A0AAV6L3N5_9ERIC|nr:hypothetical protein RHGRI_009278 [Rhododendron griersonianum]